MNNLSIVISLTILLLLCLQMSLVSLSCEGNRTCTECIRSGCSWCYYREDESEEVICTDDPQSKTICRKGKIQPERKGTQEVLINVDSSESNTFLSLKPQKVRLTLSKGETKKFKLQFRNNAMPLDIFYVVDMTKTMEEVRDEVIEATQEIEKDLIKIHTSSRQGYGTFADKPVPPFRSLTPIDDDRWIEPHVFKVERKLESKPLTYPKKRVYSVSADPMEAGIEALTETMLCSEEIGWSDLGESKRIIIYASDATFHIAGDGKLGGLFQPYDLKCHLKKENGELKSIHASDYPNIGQLKYLLSMGEFFVLFAVNPAVMDDYKPLEELLSSCIVEELDKKKILEQLKKYIKSVQSIMRLEATNYRDDLLDVKIRSRCDSRGTPKQISECKNVKENAIIDIEVEVTLKKCPDPEETLNADTIVINAFGHAVSTQIEVRLQCECNCEKRRDEKCEHGENKCGVCECHDGYWGKHCNCHGANQIDQNENEKCRQYPSSKICSGSGECECGKCACKTESITGKFCECDNEACPRKNKALCSGHGACKCGKCNCNPGWSGDDCSCSQKTEKCLDPRNLEKPCNGQGTCECNNVCRCAVGFKGKYCESCVSEACAICPKVEECALCRFSNVTDCKEECQIMRDPNNFNMVESLADTSEDMMLCSIFDKENCKIEFKYKEYRDQIVDLLISNKRNCPLEISMATLMTGGVIVALIIVVSTVLLWHMVSYIRDRNEVRKFFQNIKKEQKTQNPIYESPVTNFTNPIYCKTAANT